MAVAASAAVAMALASGKAVAQDFMSQAFIKPGQEKFTLNLGGIVNQFDTSLKLNGESSTGTNINLESGGLKHSLSSFDVSATWRFLDRHRIDVQYFSAKRSGGRSLDTQLTIRDQVFPVGATVETDAKDHFLIADYRYSFMKTDEIELAGLLGLYGGQFKFDVNATGNDVLDPRTVQTTASTTVPLPLIGATVDWYVNPQLKLSAHLAGIKADIGDVDGSVLVVGGAVEYMLVRNLGVGLRYMYSDVDVDVNKSRFNGSTTWRMNSVSLYAKLMF
jgi:opacity protein-like surface antigen